MKSIKQVLENFNPVEDKYISREFQKYGIYLTEELEDYKHKSLYIKLAIQSNSSRAWKAPSGERKQARGKPGIPQEIIQKKALAIPLIASTANV